MSLGVPAPWQWPMYFEGTIGFFLLVEGTRHFQLSPNFLTEPDWDGLKMAYTSAEVTDPFYGQKFQFDLSHEWLEGGRNLRTRLECFSLTYGWLFTGDFDRPQPFRDDSVYWQLTPEAESAPIVYRHPSSGILLTGPQASWARWKALYPGREPWKPPQP